MFLIDFISFFYLAIIVGIIILAIVYKSPDPKRKKKVSQKRKKVKMVKGVKTKPYENIRKAIIIEDETKDWWRE